MRSTSGLFAPSTPVFFGWLFAFYPSMSRLSIFMLLALAWALAPSQAAAAPPDAAILVRFERTACYGPCPVDVLTIFQDGRMRYEGQEHSPRTGTYTARLSASEQRALRQAFDSAQFFGLASTYTSEMLDLPTYYLTYATGGRQHRVADYDKAPAKLKALEARLAQLIEAPKRWKPAK
jgi:hypothetical protein